MTDLECFEAACVAALQNGMIFEYEVVRTSFLNTYTMTVKSARGRRDFLFTADGAASPDDLTLPQMMECIES